MLKGIRVLLTGSKPHSKGETFSEWLQNFQPKIRQKIKMGVSAKDTRK